MRRLWHQRLVVHLLTVLLTVQGVLGLVPGAAACVEIAGGVHDACTGGSCERHADRTAADGCGHSHRHALHHHGDPAHAHRHRGDAPREVDDHLAGAIEAIDDACVCHLHLTAAAADCLAGVRVDAGWLLAVGLPSPAAAVVVSGNTTPDAPAPASDPPRGPPARETAIVAATILLV